MYRKIGGGGDLSFVVILILICILILISFVLSNALPTYSCRMLLPFFFLLFFFFSRRVSLVPLCGRILPQGRGGCLVLFQYTVFSWLFSPRARCITAAMITLRMHLATPSLISCVHSLPPVSSLHKLIVSRVCVSTSHIHTLSLIHI